MSAVGAKVYVFVVRYKNNPQWDRALFLYYSVNRNNISKWKICSLKYIKGGADINSKHPLFEGTAELNGLNCDVSTPTTKNFAKVEFEKNLFTMKSGDPAYYEESGRFYTMELVVIKPGEFYEAFIPQLTAA